MAPVERRLATEDEVRDLEHVVDSIPFPVWVALVASAVERFTFYAITAPWQNYVQYSQDNIGIPGALGLGQSAATTITNAFYLLVFLAPLPFAFISDGCLGRYKSLCISFLLDFCGCLVLFTTSLPFVGIQAKLIGLIFSLLFLGLGTGGVKATMSPFIGDQYLVAEPQVIVKQDGALVVVDRALTLQYIFNISYWLTNLASFSLVASTYLEKYFGFWAAYLLPLCSVLVLIPLLVFCKERLNKVSPQGATLVQAGKAIKCAIRGRGHLSAAEPSYQAYYHGNQVDWDHAFVSDLRRGLTACKLMACFVPFHLCMNQLPSNFISQAGQMRLGGVPNDAIRALNPVFCVLLGPIIQKIMYPAIRKSGIAFGPVRRITVAFLGMSIAIAFAAGLQKLIYTRGPCYEHPLACPLSDGGRIANDVSVWLQTPLYLILAFAEIIGFTTLYEYSYVEAPATMRSVVQALGQLSSCVGSALGIAFAPLDTNPQILYFYAGLGATMFVISPAFWLKFRLEDFKTRGAS